MNINVVELNAKLGEYLQYSDIHLFLYPQPPVHGNAIKLSSSYGVGVQIFRFGNAVLP